MPSASRGTSAGQLSTEPPAQTGGHAVAEKAAAAAAAGSATIPEAAAEATIHAEAGAGTAVATPGGQPSPPSAASPSAPSPKPFLSPQSSSPSLRPSFLSRLSLPRHLPLRKRNRNVADFHVRPDEPHRKYGAGEHVCGAVVLVVVKPLRISHLVVTLLGGVRVFKVPTARSKNQAASVTPPQGTSDHPQYRGHGFASLFQDEQILSGEGRLDPGRYEFNFDLLLPQGDLPSSIDFERGNISYTISATLTRPTSITPPISVDRKVVLVEQVDIGLLAPPRPRTIFLEPISRRNKKKRSMGPGKASSAPSNASTDLVSEAGSANPSVATEDVTRDGPADVRSEVSGESGRSVSTISRTDFTQLSQVGTTLSSSARQQAVDDKTITATIELVKGGCLPGDTVTARIRVQHIKPLKSMTGVVVTLFRQGKVDSSPSPLLFGDGTSRKLRDQQDDAYPRSRAGLAGLSLSSTSSINMFRKDLDQNTAPLIIDPVTLQAVVTISVKLPDDVFPTIRGVPADMIGFKYQVEVIIDLGGKLANQFQGRSSRFGSNNAENNSNVYGPKRESHIADTAPLRREKGVISVSMETVVGTMDSSRSVQRRVSPSRIAQMGESDDDDAIRPELGYLDEGQHASAHSNGPMPNGYFPTHLPPSDQRYRPPSTPPPPVRPPYTESAGVPRPEYTHTNGHANGAAPIYVPLPQVPDQNGLSEKERVKQAEMRLLPSEPAGPSGAPANDDDIYDADNTRRGTAPDDAGEGPSAPTLEEISHEDVAEDKQELERRRLISEASAPPEFPEDMDSRRTNGTGRRAASAAAVAATAPDAEPSAPTLDEDDAYPGYGVGAGPSGSGTGQEAEQLPAYVK